MNTPSIFDTFYKLDLNWREIKDSLVCLKKDNIDDEEAQVWFYYNSKNGKATLVSNILSEKIESNDYIIGINSEYFTFKFYTKKEKYNRLISDKIKCLLKPLTDKLLDIPNVAELSIHYIGPNGIVPKHIDVTINGIAKNIIYNASALDIHIICNEEVIRIQHGQAVSFSPIFYHEAHNDTDKEWILLVVKTFVSD
jgi:hypothetical protein